MQATIQFIDKKQVGQYDTDVYQLKLDDGMRVGSGFDKDIRKKCRQLNKGDTVEYEYEENGNFNNLTKIEKVEGEAPKPNDNRQSRSAPQGQDSGRQDAIMRQSAMGYAATLVAATLTSKSDVEQAADTVVSIAENILVPYAKYGIKHWAMHRASDIDDEQREPEEQGEAEGSPTPKKKSPRSTKIQ